MLVSRHPGAAETLRTRSSEKDFNTSTSDLFALRASVVSLPKTFARRGNFHYSRTENREAKKRETIFGNSEPLFPPSVNSMCEVRLVDRLAAAMESFCLRLALKMPAGCDRSLPVYGGG